jgi:hypothetical protein
MTPQVDISDVAIWIKHVHHEPLKMRLRELPDNAVITLEVDGVVGNWIRMKTGKDGRPTEAIRPYGPMKQIWSEWYRNRRGRAVPIREIQVADTYLKSVSGQFSEWDSPEDNEAFRDL